MNLKVTEYSKFKNHIIENNISALEQGNSFKLICGASLTESETIEALTLIYSLAGANCIDVSPDYNAIDAAKKGIEKAKKYYENSPKKYPNFTEPMLIISINASDDPHFRTATIDSGSCINCKTCLPECSFSAIILMKPDRSPMIQRDLCYGCGQCTFVCPQDSINLEENPSDIETILTKLIDYSINGIEVHVGSASQEDLEEYWKKIELTLGKERMEELLFSFSLESSLYSNKEFVEYTNFINKLTLKKPIIQIDGKPMSGNSDAASSLQALASCQVLSQNNKNYYIQLAGGINHLTTKYIKMFDLECNGIAMGTFARKMVWPYITKIEDEKELEKAIRIATYLVKGLEF